MYANFLADTVSPGLTSIGGSQHSLTVNPVAVCDNGVATELLTRSGFYTYGNETNDHTSTLSGMSPEAGSTVVPTTVVSWQAALV